MKTKTNIPLIIAIIVAALLISGSVVFLGLQLSGDNNAGDAQVDIQAEVKKGVDSVLQNQKAEVARAKAEANKPKIVEGDFSDDDAFMGDVDAPVTIVEWSDYECPFCKRFVDNTLSQIIENYVDTGKVKLVYRDFPLSFHKGARPSAIAAECAREQGNDETYFKYHDLIFENQGSLDTATLKEHAVTLGLNSSQFDECLDSEKYDAEVSKDFADGQKAGITGTPGFLVGGQLVTGARPYSAFVTAIEAALK